MKYFQPIRVIKNDCSVNYTAIMFIASFTDKSKWPKFVPQIRHTHFAIAYLCTELFRCGQKKFYSSEYRFVAQPPPRCLSTGSMSTPMTSTLTSNKRRRRNVGANATKICLRFVDENSGAMPRRPPLQSLRSPLMPTLAESGREESDHDNVISLTYSVPAELMRSLQESNRVRVHYLPSVVERADKEPLKQRTLTVVGGSIIVCSDHI